MSYKQIDEQVEKWFKTQLGTAGDNQKLRNLLHQIYSQAKAEQREETAKEIIEMIEKDESDYDFGDDYSIAKYNMVKLIKSKYGIGEKDE